MGSPWNNHQSYIIKENPIIFKMTKNSIALIGFMGVGKTTIGKLLTQNLGIEYKFIETDEIIAQEAGKSVLRIFKEDGEERFREYEISACKKASKLNRTVISCGGGVVLNKINIRNLKKNSYIVLLKATPEEIYERLMKDGKESRPLLNKDDPKNEIEKILRVRSQNYIDAAEIIINTTGKKIKDIINEIVKKTLLKT